jgi:hypothetical protein
MESYIKVINKRGVLIWDGVVGIFKVLLGIMLITNSAYVPNADNREGGLVRLFRDYTDVPYFNKVVASLRTRKWRTMGAFLAEYQAACLEHYQLSQDAL